MANTYKNCQSCGMPMNRDEKGGGTEANGAKSVKFCSHCYEGGAFTLPDLTLAQMQDRVKDKMKEFGFPRWLGGLFTRNMHKLERWQNR